MEIKFRKRNGYFGILTTHMKIITQSISKAFVTFMRLNGQA